MKRHNSRPQQGFGLLIFVIVTAVIAFSLVVGYTGVLTKSQANRLQATQSDYLSEVRTQVMAFYQRKAFALDQQSMSNPVSVNDLLAGALVRKRFGLQAALSDVLSLPDGVRYRRIAVWLPSDTDTDNPPDLSSFTQTGKFVSCTNLGSPCADRQMAVFDSIDLERELQKETQARLRHIALKAQAYFKARTLQDPERNISVNYFRPLANICTPRDMELECLDIYTPLSVPAIGGALVPSRTASTLGLTGAELVSAWGLPIEASNVQDAVTDDTPFTMVFRAARPSGGYYSIRAIQQL